MTMFGVMLWVILGEATAIVGLLAECHRLDKEYKRRLDSLQELKKGA